MPVELADFIIFVTSPCLLFSLPTPAPTQHLLMYRLKFSKLDRLTGKFLANLWPIRPYRDVTVISNFFNLVIIACYSIVIDSCIMVIGWYSMAICRFWIVICHYFIVTWCCLTLMDRPVIVICRYWPLCYPYQLLGSDRWYLRLLNTMVIELLCYINCFLRLNNYDLSSSCHVTWYVCIFMLQERLGELKTAGLHSPSLHILCKNEKDYLSTVHRLTYFKSLKDDERVPSPK